MTEPTLREYSRHRLSGGILIGLAITSLALGFLIFLFASNFPVVLTLAILAIVFFNFGFDHFEKAAKFRTVMDA